MVKRGMMLLMLLTCALGLCACSSEQVSISEENEQKVVDYASNVLVEHDANHEATIRSFSEKELNRIVKLDLLAAVEKAGLNEEPTEEAEASDENTDGSSGSSGEGSQDSEEPSKTIAEALSLNDFDISFTGYDVVDQYPEEANQDIGTFIISPGSSEDKLLVLHFNVFNAGADKAVCDILNIRPQFRLVLNDKKHSFLNTLLLNDLTIFDSEIEAGASDEAVLIAEISNEKAENISSIGMIVKTNGENIKVSLE